VVCQPLPGKLHRSRLEARRKGQGDSCTNAVAINKADLLDGALVAAINHDQNGDLVDCPGEVPSDNCVVWTATLADGTLPAIGEVQRGTCSDWTSNSQGQEPPRAGRTGIFRFDNPDWTDATNGNCSVSEGAGRLAKLYCFQLE
jgi:hypothetical protein